MYQTYELFSGDDSLSDEKSKLKISYVNKAFQKKPSQHFCFPHIYITNEIFFVNDLFYIKNKIGQFRQCGVRSPGLSDDELKPYG